jgi:hypothetical protein
MNQDYNWTKLPTNKKGIILPDNRVPLLGTSTLSTTSINRVTPFIMYLKYNIELIKNKFM